MSVSGHSMSRKGSQVWLNMVLLLCCIPNASYDDRNTLVSFIIIFFKSKNLTTLLFMSITNYSKASSLRSSTAPLKSLC